MLEEKFEQRIEQLVSWKKYDLARKEINEWITHDPESAEAYAWLGYVFFLQDDYKACIQWSEKSLSLSQDDPNVFAILADAYRILKKGKKSIEIIESAIKLFPNNLQIIYFKSLLELKNLKYQQALKYVNHGLSINPEETELLKLKATILEKIGVDQAEDLIKKSLSIDPLDSDAFVLKGWFEINKREYSRAEALFKNALQLDPENSEARQGYMWAIKAMEFPGIMHLLNLLRIHKVKVAILFVVFIIGLFGGTFIGQFLGFGSWLLCLLIFYGFLVIMRTLGLMDAIISLGLEEEFKEKNFVLSDREISRYTFKVIRFFFVLIVFCGLLYWYW